MPADALPPSVAALLDDVRPLIVDARARGEAPRFLMLPHDAYDAVAACRIPDRERGLPMIVLGLEIVRAEDPSAQPRVF
ncbi:MAG: hypothetical protein ABR591_09565 [Candidatus Velthaea sp.]